MKRVLLIQALILNKNKLKALDRQLSMEFTNYYEKHSKIPWFSPLVSPKHNKIKRTNTTISNCRPQDPPWGNWKQSKHICYHQNFNCLDEESNESKSISELSSKDSQSDKPNQFNKICLPQISSKEIDGMNRKSKNESKLADILKPK